MRKKLYILLLLAPLAAEPAAALAAEQLLLAQQPSPDAGLSLLDAVRLTFERDPNVAFEEARLAAASGALLIAAGAFDAIVTSTVTRSETLVPESSTNTSESRALDGTVALTQRLRTGLSFEPEIVLSQLDEVGSGDPVADTATVTFRFRQPLLRGRGRAATAAGERAAERELAASGLDLSHVVAGRLAAVAAQYWTVAAAARDLAVLRDSEASSRALVDNTRKLIEADQIPAAELVQVEANLAAKESSTLDGERALFTARQDLGREIGLEAEEIGRLPLPGDPFPAVVSEEVPPATEAAALTALALARRADLLAAEQRREAVALLRRAAVSALQPQLDLILAPGYSGLDTGGGVGRFFSPLARNVPGASVELGLALSWPTLNRQAEGELVQIDAALRQSELAVELIAKAIGADVPSALEEVGRNAQRLGKARQAVRLFERAVLNEEKKLRAGTSTLLDLISQRDRLTAAQQGVVSGELALALALLRLRFETGTLFEERGEARELQLSRLTTLPAVPPLPREGRP